MSASNLPEVLDQTALVSASAAADAAPTLLAPTTALLRGFVLEVAPAAQNLAQLPARSKADGPAALAGIQLREGFRIGGLGLMIRYEDGSELTDMPATYRLPNAPDWFVGMSNLHGALVPVFDLARYFGVKHADGIKPMLLVLAHGADAAGVVIDGLPARLRFSATDRAQDAPVPSALQSSVSQTYIVGEHPWMDLQVDALLRQLSDELAAAGQ